MTLPELIKERIRKDGPMMISEYMALALAHPEYGYYVRKDPLGVKGDFTTAPEISQIFGEIIGAWLVMQWIIMGKPQAALAEIGPGRGTLMSDILRATAGIGGFHDSITVHLMELSPVLRQKQWTAIGGKHTDVRWHMGFGEIPSKPLLLVANEFFDALPIRQFLHEEDGWKERCVALGKKDELEFILQPATPPYHLKNEPVSKTFYEYSEAATQMMLVMSNRIFTYGGTALIVDYGYEGSTHGNTLQAVREHRRADALDEPGTADLTAHVDFFNLTRTAAAGGCTVHGPVSQAAFLNKLGARERAEALCKKASKKQAADILSGLARLTAPDQMGELFKVLCIAHPDLPKPEGF